MNSSSIFAFLLCSFIFEVSLCFDPISLGTGAAIAVSSVAIGGLTYARCRFYECCNRRWINTNMTDLDDRLRSQLYGQHLAINTVTKHVAAHMRNPNPSKALALSFHGWTGTGKNYVSQILAKHIFKEGMKSKYVHLISATREFPHSEKISEYKDSLKRWIEGNITNCERSLFIFDEMDKLPSGLLDVIKPYLEYYEDISGVVYRKAIYIFLSNTAGSAISRLVLQHWHTAKPREELTLKDLEKSITMEAVNHNDDNKGMWHSELITKNLITAFIPFLPLEREHVTDCVIDALLSKGYLKIREEANSKMDVINEVIGELSFYPDNEQLYSTTGCKRVAEKVDLVLEDI